MWEANLCQQSTQRSCTIHARPKNLIVGYPCHSWGVSSDAHARPSQAASDRLRRIGPFQSPPLLAEIPPSCFYARRNAGSEPTAFAGTMDVGTGCAPDANLSRPDGAWKSGSGSPEIPGLRCASTLALESRPVGAQDRKKSGPLGPDTFLERESQFSVCGSGANAQRACRRKVFGRRVNFTRRVNQTLTRRGG